MIQTWIHSTQDYQTKLLSGMDLKRNQLRLSFSHPTQSIPVGPQFKAMNVYIIMNEVPLPNNFNLHRQAGEMIYNDLNKISLTIS